MLEQHIRLLRIALLKIIELADNGETSAEQELHNIADVAEQALKL